MEERIAALERELASLKRAYAEHRHTGLDSKLVDLTDQIESQGELTAASSATVDATYGAEEAGVINNSRTRIGEIEDALQAYGILS